MKHIISISLIIIFMCSANIAIAQDQDVRSEIEDLINKIRSIDITDAITEEPETEQIEDCIIDLGSDHLIDDPNIVSVISDPNDQTSDTETTQIDIDRMVCGHEQIENPFALAELLYRNKQYTSSAHCYRKALDRIADTSEQNNDKAWMLLQIGNCIKITEPNKAIDAYRQITSMFPLSIWAELAKAQIELTQWYIKEKPEQLIAK